MHYNYYIFGIVSFIGLFSLFFIVSEVQITGMQSLEGKYTDKSNDLQIVEITPVKKSSFTFPKVISSIEFSVSAQLSSQTLPVKLPLPICGENKLAAEMKEGYWTKNLCQEKDGNIFHFDPVKDGEKKAINLCEKNQVKEKLSEVYNSVNCPLNCPVKRQLLPAGKLITLCNPGIILGSTIYCYSSILFMCDINQEHPTISSTSTKETTTTKPTDTINKDFSIKPKTSKGCSIEEISNEVNKALEDAKEHFNKMEDTTKFIGQIFGYDLLTPEIFNNFCKNPSMDLTEFFNFHIYEACDAVNTGSLKCRQKIGKILACDDSVWKELEEYGITRESIRNVCKAERTNQELKKLTTNCIELWEKEKDEFMKELHTLLRSKCPPLITSTPAPKTFNTINSLPKINSPPQETSSIVSSTTCDINNDPCKGRDPNQVGFPIIGNSCPAYPPEYNTPCNWQGGNVINPPCINIFEEPNCSPCSQRCYAVAAPEEAMTPE